MLRVATQTTTIAIATTLSQRNRTGEKLIGGKLSFRTEMLRKLKCNRGKADYWKTLWLHFVRTPPSKPLKHRIEDLMQSPRPSMCLCVCVCDTCATGRAYLWVLLQNVCQKGQELLCRAMSRPVPQLSRLAGQAEEAFGVRCNDVLVCSATLAIKYKYAIKQTRTGRAYALLQWPAVGGDIC